MESVTSNDESDFFNNLGMHNSRRWIMFGMYFHKGNTFITASKVNYIFCIPMPICYSIIIIWNYFSRNLLEVLQGVATMHIQKIKSTNCFKNVQYK